MRVYRKVKTILPKPGGKEILAMEWQKSSNTVPFDNIRIRKSEGSAQHGGVGKHCVFFLHEHI